MLDTVVECVFAFPAGARAIGRVGAHRFDAAGVSNAIVASRLVRVRNPPTEAASHRCKVRLYPVKIA